MESNAFCCAATKVCYLHSDSNNKDIMKNEIYSSHPNKRFHNWTCLSWIVTSLPTIAMSLTWENMRTRKASAASCRAKIAVDWYLTGSLPRSRHTSWDTSRTSRWKGIFLMSNSVDFWYRTISRRATVPGRCRRGFFNFLLFTRGRLFPVGVPVVDVFLVLVIFFVVGSENKICDHIMWNSSFWNSEILKFWNYEIMKLY